MAIGCELLELGLSLPSVRGQLECTLYGRIPSMLDFDGAYIQELVGCLWTPPVKTRAVLERLNGSKLWRSGCRVGWVCCVLLVGWEIVCSKPAFQASK